MFEDWLIVNGHRVKTLRGSTTATITLEWEFLNAQVPK
jgi:hypothetical protein